MADATNDPKKSAVDALLSWLKALGVQVAEDLTGPEMVTKIDTALNGAFPVLNGVIEAFSPGWASTVEKFALPWGEGKLVGVINSAVASLHAHLAGSSTVEQVAPAEALKSAATAPSIQAVHASPEEAAALTTPEAKREFVAAHQPGTAQEG